VPRLAWKKRNRIRSGREKGENNWNVGRAATSAILERVITGRRRKVIFSTASVDLRRKKKRRGVHGTSKEERKRTQAGRDRLGKVNDGEHSPMKRASRPPSKGAARRKSGFFWGLQKPGPLPAPSRE